MRFSTARKPWLFIRGTVSKFSRTGVTSPFGKLTVPVGPYKLPEETVALIDEQASRLGITRNEFLRDLAILRAHGKEVVESVHIRRVSVVAGKVVDS